MNLEGLGLTILFKIQIKPDYYILLFHQAEPLHLLGIRRVYSEKDVNKTDAYEIVRNILNCNNSAFKGTFIILIKY